MGERINCNLGQQMYLAFWYVIPCPYLLAETDSIALFDYNEERAGDRASSIGEKPYLDPNSQYKSEALKAEGKKW